jgi:hypothetical protein
MPSHPDQGTTSSSTTARSWTDGTATSPVGTIAAPPWPPSSSHCPARERSVHRRSCFSWTFVGLLPAYSRTVWGCEREENWTGSPRDWDILSSLSMGSLVSH